MKPKFRNTILLVAVFFSFVTAANATVWYVNNIPGVDADFTNVNTAIANAAAGDTLYVEGSHLSYGDVTLNKNLVIIGTGYFIADNDSTQANPSASVFNLLTINNGAQNSIIIGISVTGTPAYDYSTVTVNTSNITFLRCNFTASANSQTYSTYRRGAVLRLMSGVNNIVISGCFIYQTYSYTSSTCSNCSFDVYALQMMGSNTGIVVTNNIIKLGSKTSATNYTGNQFAIYMPTSSSAIFTNNVIISTFQAYNSVVANNIQILGGISGTYNTSGSWPNTTQNNIGFSTQFGTLNGNQSNVTMTNVFTYAPGNENVDNHYRLKAGSPAIGAGVSGEDCGAFGGNGGHIGSGIPGIPAIFNATVPATGSTTSGVNINIKAKSHK